jgi:prepilin-type N-terminal cleavage/methylation domain-containing protein
MRKGFTLIELLVAIGISSVVFMIVGSVLALFVAQNTKSVRQEAFEQVKNNLAVELSNSIRWGNEISYGLGSLVVDGITYDLTGGTINKNGSSLISSNVVVTRFEIADKSTNPELKSFEIDIEFTDRNYAVYRDQMHLVVSQRKTGITF